MTFGKDNEPAMRCPACDTFFEPGLDLYDKIRKVVHAE